ncbi:class C beta-lactamase-related serine hydrolase [Zobellia amurskyensis]|uniref:Class C beta-lactamase-related serine hydrolase n=1 Tax=Zobellia amurskyensis TaxID=248905 RepID=A0A7X2ZVL2_9FLAO|nr:serine hydrolase [Zobellia amurskyensis]MUH37228.1 class C beta-lactamase-related serine hydrolase [Zobellia amurskyensis]
MKYIHSFILCFILIALTGCSKDKTEVDPDEKNQPMEMYFPEVGSLSWETITPEQLNWDEANLPDLYDYLERKNSKGFIILKNGRIVVEKYFNGHSENNDWLWYSAGKTLVSSTVGIAQDEGFLSINDKSSDYLGDNWSSLTTEKQDLITVKNHLSMNTGLQDYVGQILKWICTQPSCFDYEADAGERWAYHQGAFTMLKDVVTNATATDFKEYFNTKIRDKIGMDGSWSEETLLTLYSSNTRSMARWGLLIENEGVWDTETIISKTYINQMTNTSQSINKSYGYLWWLNGKESYMSTTSQTVVSGSLVPNAPADMIAALGANDQKIYVIPSRDLVVVRCGDSAGETQLGLSSFDNELWDKISAVIN